MPNVFVFKPVVPKPYNVARVHSAIMNALRDEGRDTLPLLNQTISTWSDPPSMKAKVEMRGADAVMEAGPSDKGSFQGKKWFWLNYGTQVRYALLSRDWQSKTKPGSIRSGMGAGRVLLRGYKAGRHPGIDARGWVYIIEKMRSKPFQVRMQRAVAQSLRP